MNKSIALAADASRLAALLPLVLMSHPSRMLISVLTRALPSGRLGRDHRPNRSFEGPNALLVLTQARVGAEHRERPLSPKNCTCPRTLLDGAENHLLG